MQVSSAEPIMRQAKNNMECGNRHWSKFKVKTTPIQQYSV